MVIEPTDEMVAAYAKAFNAARQTPRREGYAERDGLAAVLAIVERDYELLPYCNAELTPDIVCKLSQVIGHRDHKGAAPNGSTVTWANAL
jgi:hypothetical protein